MAAPAYVTQGGAVAVTTTCAPTYPASGIVAGDILILFVSSDATGIGAAPAGWTLLGATQTGGGMSCRAWWRVAAGGETGGNTVNVTSGTKGVAWVAQYRPAAGTVTVTGLYGSDTTATAAAYSATSGSTWTSAVDDTIAGMTAALAATGSFTASPSAYSVTQANASATSTGRFGGRTGTNTLSYHHTDAAVTSGGTGAPTMNLTCVGANAGGSSALVLIHVSSDTTYTKTQDDTADGTDAATRAAQIVRGPADAAGATDSASATLTAGNVGDDLGVSIPGWILASVSAAVRNSMLDRVVGLGATWLRFDLDWTNIEGTQGVFDWAEVDTIVTAANARGLKMLGILGTMPLWAQTGTPVWNHGPTTATDRSRYATFVTNAVTRYKTSIHHWEIWNEPNLDQFWDPTPSAAAYGALLAAAYPAAKAADATATVIAGVTGGSGGAPDIDAPDFIAGIYSGGYGAYFDAISVHPYTDLATTDAATAEMANAATIRATMNANGDSAMTLWGTETGAPTSLTYSVTEARQAALVGETWTAWKNIANTSTLFWYTLDDTGNAADREDFFGLYRANGTAKPAVAAFQSLAASTSFNVANKADTAGATDSATRAAQTVRAPADTAGGVDATTVAASRAVSDTAGGTDSVSTGLTLSVTVTDTATARDTDADQVIDFTATTGDTASGGDTTGDLATANVTVTDTAAGSDSTATDGTAYVTVADAAAGSDSASWATVFVAAVADTAAGTDGISRSTTALPADMAGATDSATSGAVTPTSATDAAGATDATTRMVGTVRADTAGGTDSATTTAAREAALTDTASATDSAIGSLSGASAASIPDTAGATDSVTRTTSQLVAQADTAAATDSATASTIVTPGPSDAAAAGDIVVAIITRAQAIAEYAAATDAVSTDLVRAGDSLVTDAIAGFDTVEVGLTRLVQVADAAAATDLAASQKLAAADGHPVPLPRLIITTPRQRLELR